MSEKLLTLSEMQKKKEREKQLLRTGASVANHIAHGRLDKAFRSAVVSGIKLADDQSFNSDANPLFVTEVLKGLFGVECLGWKPETLMAAIDRRIHGWSDEKIALALEHFHNTGEIKTDVSPLLRQKIYAIRIVATSDTAHSEWHIFEKVGCAFNDRVANFGVVEKLSVSECAKTIALIENIRPDSYTSEIKNYIAACAHEEGFYTLKPSKYLNMAESDLLRLNKESMGVPASVNIILEIQNKYTQMGQDSVKIDPDSLVDIQAMRLFAADAIADEAVR